MDLYKYPRTPHLVGSRLQPGDEDLPIINLEALNGCHVVIEEKVDGSNSGLSFSSQGELLLQSRGHYLLGGDRERHFDLFKRWANNYYASLYQALGDKYIVYGEWLYAKHTIFYDQLPHYFLEFDIFDKEQKQFLDTTRRQALLAGLPIVSAPILFQGQLGNTTQLGALLTNSSFISSEHLSVLSSLCEKLGISTTRALKETDPSRVREGLYIKVEANGIVQDRYKYVRSSFLTVVDNSASHWQTRAIIPNQLQEGVSIF